MTRRRGFEAAFLTLAWAAVALGAPTVGVVSHVRVTTDAVADVSSMEAWKQAFIREGMSDREKALAVWETVVAFRHQDQPPDEFLQGENNVHDAIKTFNVYGYGMCCCASANIEALARYVGLPARGRIIRGHSVPEVYWEGAWHLLDASLINYFPDGDGHIAGVDDIMAGVKTWYDSHPEFRGNDGKLRQFMVNGGWRNGPDVLTHCLFYDNNGWLPAATHGWYSTMQEYDGSANGIYEYGYSQGYQVNVQLRPGERLTRCWHHKGLHVNMEAGGVGCLDESVGQGQMRYAPAFGDLAPGRIGNGTREYELPLADGVFRTGALVCENLSGGGERGRARAVSVGDPERPGVLVLRMPSSYVYLSGRLLLESVVPQGGLITVSLSDNNGLDWTELRRIQAQGITNLDLGPSVFRRYDYRIKFVLTGAGTGLNRVNISHDLQHSQRALPALIAGTNTVRFCAAPCEGTITVEGSTDPANKARQLVTSDFHASLAGVREHLLRVEAAEGTVTFPIETPGDMVRLRLGAHFRARDKQDAWDLQASFDEGLTFRTVGRLGGPTPGNSHYISVDDIPAHTRKALVRFSGTQRNTTCIFGYRLDADYREPHGGFRPVRIAYAWKENGRVRQHVHVTRSPEETYTIRCDAKPVMLSLALELTGNGEQVPSEAARERPPGLGPRTVNLPVAVGLPVQERPTLHSLGVYWPIAGDSNRNACVALHVRRAGEESWRECLPLFRVEPGAHLPPEGTARVTVPSGAVLFAGSALCLDPDTAYDLRLRLTDPDAPVTEYVLSARTMAEPVAPDTLHTIDVIPGDGGGRGTAADPYRGLATAQGAVSPGTRVRVHAGVYPGTFAVTRSGEPGRPIVWQSAGDGETILDGSAGTGQRPGRVISASGCHDVWFEGLTIRNGDWGVVAHESSRIVVRRCTIRDVEYGLTATRNGVDVCRDFFIADNRFEGPCVWPRSKGIENARGIQLTGTGHVVCYNAITGFADAVDTFPSAECSAIDIHNNDIDVMTDDGIEMDYSFRNTRCFRNRLTNVFNGISMQPVYGGPVYVFNNFMYNVGDSPFKLHNGPSGALMLHNTSIKTGVPMVIWSSAPVRNCVFRNNLFVGTKGKYAFESMAPMKGCDLDYDGFAGGPWGQFLKWNGIRYATLAEAAATGLLYAHGQVMPATGLFVGNILPPEDESRRALPLRGAIPRPGGPAANAGVLLSGVSGNVDGDAPDLGAFQRGALLPQYGPRPLR